MPDLNLPRLARDLADMRTGHGPRRAELRRRLAQVDGKLREERNLERLKLAGLKARLGAFDTRLDNAVLRQAVERSAARLSLLDQQILEAIAIQLRPRAP
jgi:hypothetical protein